MPPKQAEKKVLVKSDKLTQGEKKQLKNANKAKANPDKAAAKKEKNDATRARRYVPIVMSVVTAYTYMHRVCMMVMLMRYGIKGFARLISRPLLVQTLLFHLVGCFAYRITYSLHSRTHTHSSSVPNHIHVPLTVPYGNGIPSLGLSLSTYSFTVQ